MQTTRCRIYGQSTTSLVIFGNPLKGDVWVEDTAIAATLVQLTAEDLGLGSCWIQVRLRDYDSNLSSNDYCKQLLNAPEHLETASIIAIGYKEKERSPYTDEHLTMERVHKNGF